MTRFLANVFPTFTIQLAPNSWYAGDSQTASTEET